MFGGGGDEEFVNNDGKGEGYPYYLNHPSHNAVIEDRRNHYWQNGKHNSKNNNNANREPSIP